MTVGIVGLGLIGGSIGLALREPGRKILGYDPNSASAKTAFDRGCIDKFSELEELCKADVVFVAVPPQYVAQVLEDVKRLKGPETIFTECTSVKAGVIAWAMSADEPNFIISHPMAGHEERGLAQVQASFLGLSLGWFVDLPLQPGVAAPDQGYH